MPGDGGWEGSIDAHLLSDVHDDDHHDDHDDDHGDDHGDHDHEHDDDHCDGDESDVFSVMMVMRTQETDI